MCRFALMLGLLWLTAAGLPATEVKIIKVLPHYLDAEGRSSLSPSLFERDAYQAYLRKNRAKRSALRFDVQWKAPGAEARHLKLRLEVLGTVTHREAPLVVEQPAKRNPGLGRWSSVTLEEEALKRLGEVVAWRVTLWSEDRQLAEQRSFLW